MMKDIISTNLENEEKNLWQAYLVTNPNEKRFMQDFWANYEKLIARAREKQQLIKEPAPVAEMYDLSMATMNPWEALATQHWDAVPMSIHYKKEVYNGARTMIKTIIVCGLGVLTFVALTITYSAILAFIGMASIFLLVYSSKSHEVDYTFTFQADHLHCIKKKKMLYAMKRPPVIDLQIPYDTIKTAVIVDKGIAVIGSNPNKWRDTLGTKHHKIMIPGDVKYYSRLYAFLQDIIQVNQQYRILNP